MFLVKFLACVISITSYGHNIPCGSVPGNVIHEGGWGGGSGGKFNETYLLFSEIVCSTFFTTVDGKLDTAAMDMIFTHCKNNYITSLKLNRKIVVVLKNDE